LRKTIYSYILSIFGDNNPKDDPEFKAKSKMLSKEEFLVGVVAAVVAISVTTGTLFAVRHQMFYHFLVFF